MKCQFRFRNFLDEALLLHLPMCVCVALMTWFIASSFMLVMSVALMQNKDRTFQSFFLVLNSKAQLRKISLITCLCSVLMLVWLSQAVTARYVSENYLNTVQIHRETNYAS